MDTFFATNTDIRERFRLEIKKKALVQARIAEQIGIGRSYLNDILNQRFPITKHIEDKLNAFLGTNFTSEQPLSD